MTALLAAGGGLPLALHIPHVVEQVGSIAGFAAVIGLALLSALYFSQARDLRRLREWAGRAPERAADTAAGGQPVPGRVMAVPQRAAQPPAAAGAATAAGAAQGAQAAGPNGSATVEATKTPEAEAAKVGAGEGEKAGDGAPQPGGESADGAAAKESSESDGQDKPGDADPAAGAPKPGMPAPASAAAAAAGAGAASVTAPGTPGTGPGSRGGAPGAGGSVAGGSPPSPGAAGAAAAGGAAARPGAPPQRTPGSVLPPRTGTLPPVRRLPSSNVGRTGTPQPGVVDAALEPKRGRNPVYVALAIAGVLVLGAGAAIGVPKLVNGAKSNTTPSKATTTAKKNKKAAKALPPISADTITVSVLNATSIPGLAAQIGDQAQNIGFNLGSTAQVPGILEGSKPQRVSSVVLYVPGHVRDARLVAKKLSLKGGVKPIDAESRQLGGDATVVVVVGTDQTR
jgi:hypothetical protein